MKGLTIFERRQNILRLLAEQPGLRVGDMATYFDVSEGTIRNDLNALEEDNRLRRVRGGAVLVSPAGLLTFTGNGQPTVTTEADSKERIARWAAETIEDGDTILLDASSTVQFMIPYLKSFERLTIVTNGLVTARQVARTTDHPVVLIGGVVSRAGNATTSLLGLDIMETLHVRTAYVSGVGFALQTGLTERNIEEAQLKRALVAHIPRLVALVDASKIGAVGAVPFLANDQISHLFTDSGVEPEFIEQMRQARVNLTVCGENTVRSFRVDGDTPTFTIGFANESETLPFAVDVRRSLERAAVDAGNVDLVVADNQLSGEKALEVADRLIQRQIDLAIEYQIDYKAGNLIMDKFQQAGIPVIAVDIPMVGATFFGVDNYRAGHLAGSALGNWIRQRWGGRIDNLLVLEEPRAGWLPHARIQGQLDGLQELLGEIPAGRIQTIDCGNTSAISAAGVRERLVGIPAGHHIAAVCFNDEAAFGALQAAREAGREADFVIVGQGADRLVWDEIRNPDSRLIGSTAYMPERYGEKLMELALKILRGESVPPAVYTSHAFVDHNTIDHYYPAVD
ncbi:MAG: substrate-binding domain-containing protein [Anaerolineales bacterium]|nr:substrate-binding domain-containing protein [Anaerolineales bacterium]